MIEEKIKTVTRYTAVCDSCGRRFYEKPRRSMAEWDLTAHKCGEHRREHSTGGFRGILGGWNVSCVCGEHWVDHEGNMPFKCPKDVPLSVRSATASPLRRTSSTHSTSRHSALMGIPIARDARPHPAAVSLVHLGPESVHYRLVYHRGSPPIVSSDLRVRPRRVLPTLGSGPFPLSHARVTITSDPLALNQRMSG